MGRAEVLRRRRIPRRYVRRFAASDFFQGADQGTRRTLNHRHSGRSHRRNTGVRRDVAILHHATVSGQCPHNLILVDPNGQQAIKNETVIELIPFTFERSAYSFGGAMHDSPKLAAQVRGARALLGWSRSYLAEGIRVRRVIIADLESCKREQQASTLSALITELSAAGIVFTETGVASGMATETLRTDRMRNDKEAREKTVVPEDAAGD